MRRCLRTIGIGAVLIVASSTGSLGANGRSPVPAAACRPLARLALDEVVDAPASVSADGRYVAFESRADLVAAGVNSGPDIYVLDRVTGRLTLESIAFDGGSANGPSRHPRLSGDGRWLVFESWATNLARERLGQHVDIFLRDRITGTTRGLTPSWQASNSLNHSTDAVISQDGRVVAFTSNDTRIVDDAGLHGAGYDIYVLTLATGAITRASVTSSGVRPASGGSLAPSLSADGTVVAFVSTEDLQRGGAALERAQIFVRDLAHGTTRLVSASRDGVPADQISHTASISGDGRFVAFVSAASNLGSADDKHISHIYLRDLQTGAISLISRTPHGRAGNGHSSRPAISANGQFVAFVSEASDLACDRRCSPNEVDDNLLSDVYLADVRSGAVQRVSGADHVWWNASQAPAIDEHGTTIVFPSMEPIDPRDVNHDFDLYVWVRSAPPAG